MDIRRSTVAGSFYPHDPAELHDQVSRLLMENRHEGPSPKVLIVPHAGYVYSGPTAASAYSLLQECADRIRHVVLLGPSHQVAFEGLALSSAETFETPLGAVPVDAGLSEQALELDQVEVLDKAHTLEHSLEVHLPFLQVMLNQFTIVPLVVGNAEPDEVAEVLDSLWGGEETLIVISSDLSHYRPYAEAQSIDAQTSTAIENLESDLDGEQACGCAAINGLMVTAKRRDMEVSLIDLCNSGDTAGSKQKVVGYGAYGLQ